MPGWVARPDREDVSMSGTAMLAEGRQIPVEIINLSPDGCQLLCDETIGIGEMIRLDAPTLQGVAGTIRWSLLGNAGVRFIRSYGNDSGQ